MGAFYVYLKRNLIAFEFVSFLLRGDSFPPAIREYCKKGNRDIIINFYLIYFTLLFISLNNKKSSTLLEQKSEKDRKREREREK